MRDKTSICVDIKLETSLNIEKGMSPRPSLFDIHNSKGPGRDRESRTLDLNKSYRFQLFCNETMAGTSLQINRQTNTRLRRLDNKNWIETRTQPKVTVPVVSRTSASFLTAISIFALPLVTIFNISNVLNGYYCASVK